MPHIMQYIRPLGFIAIFISAFTWGLDLAHFVEACRYCQVQRTVIGLLGILMVLPDYRYFTQLFTVIFAVFGLHVSSAQIFMHVQKLTFDNIFILLASCALILISGQVLMLIARAYQRYVTLR